MAACATSTCPGTTTRSECDERERASAREDRWRRRRRPALRVRRAPWTGLPDSYVAPRCRAEGPVIASENAKPSFMTPSPPLWLHVALSSQLPPPSRQPRGIGFVEFADPLDCRDAIRYMDGLMLDGRRVRSAALGGWHRRWVVSARRAWAAMRMCGCTQLACSRQQPHTEGHGHPWQAVALQRRPLPRCCTLAQIGCNLALHGRRKPEDMLGRSGEPAGAAATTLSQPMGHLHCVTKRRAAHHSAP